MTAELIQDVSAQRRRNSTKNLKPLQRTKSLYAHSAGSITESFDVFLLVVGYS
jgi:hypothetical protein